MEEEEERGGPKIWMIQQNFFKIQCLCLVVSYITFTFVLFEILSDYLFGIHHSSFVHHLTRKRLLRKLVAINVNIV